MLLINNYVYNKKEKNTTKENMKDSIYRILGELEVGSFIRLKRLGGEVEKIRVINYKFLEDTLVIESKLFKYEFTIIYS